MLDFLFERNEHDEISNIYNYPRGRGATQTIILLAVNCNELSSTEIYHTMINFLKYKKRAEALFSIYYIIILIIIR